MGMHLHGLIAAGGVPVWAVECDPEIAQVYRMNHHGRLYVKRVEDCDPQELFDIDCLTVTLSCKNASIAQGSSWGETLDDVSAGIATAKIIKAKLPKVVLLENVWRYCQFQSFQEIEKTLAECGYYFRYYRLNTSDFGVAQSRVRLYGVAVRGGAFWDITLPNVKTCGWYEAIADLIPTFPETDLANWQKEKFPWLNKNSTALIKRVGGGRESDRIYHASKPAFTIRTFGRNADYHSVSGTAIADRKIVAVTPRACLRFFGDKETADKIWLPSKKALAQEVVGNGASWTMFKFLIQHVGVFKMESNNAA
jgi:site-specific DNA-cytosine methylase